LKKEGGMKTKTKQASILTGAIVAVVIYFCFSKQLTLIGFVVSAIIGGVIGIGVKEIKKSYGL